MTRSVRLREEAEQDYEDARKPSSSVEFVDVAA